MTNPDKHIREYFFNALEGLEVNGDVIPLYDFFNPNNDKKYILMTSASKDESYATKCGLEWECRLLFDIVTIYPAVSISRTRSDADDIQQAIIDRTQNINIEGFEVVKIERSYPNDLFATSGSNQVIRKFIRFNIKLK